MPKLRLILGNKNYSSWSLRAWLAAEACGHAFEEVVIPLYGEGSAERLAELSPTRKVPCLHVDELRICDSLAICEYLAELFPRAGLWPEDREARARARMATAEMHSGMFALRNEMPMNMRKHAPLARRGPQLEQDIARVLELWNDALSRSDGPMLFGSFSIADAFYAPVVSRFRTYGVELEGATREYAARVWELPAMRRWVESAAAEPWTIDKFEQ